MKFQRVALLLVEIVLGIVGLIGLGTIITVYSGNNTTVQNTTVNVEPCPKPSSEKTVAPPKPQPEETKTASVKAEEPRAEKPRKDLPRVVPEHRYIPVQGPIFTPKVSKIVYVPNPQYVPFQPQMQYQQQRQIVVVPPLQPRIVFVPLPRPNIIMVPMNR